MLEELRQRIFAKYDLNRDGKFNLEERESAFTDSDFIAFELDNIDTNQNGRLDAEELEWFDANQNHVLDPAEEAGIEAAQKLLAAKLLKTFDENADGGLDENEFSQVLSRDSATDKPGMRVWSGFSMYDRDHSQLLNIEELELYLEHSTLQDVRRKILQTDRRQMAVLMRPPRPTFKQMVEMYWNGLNQKTSPPMTFEHTNQARPYSTP